MFKGTSLWLELKGKKGGSRKWNQRGNEWAANSSYFVSLQLLCWEWPVWEQRWKKGPYKRPWHNLIKESWWQWEGRKTGFWLCTADGIFWWIRETKSNGTPLQDSCLENPMDGGAWQAAVHGVTKSRTRLSNFTFTFHFQALEKEMATHSSVLPWRIPGTRSLVGCRLWGRTESDTTEVT